MKSIWKILGLALVCCLGLACESTNSPVAPYPVKPTAANQGSVEYMRAGEKIQVQLADLPSGTITSDPTISEDGKITLHLDQTFQAAGKTRTQLEAEIRARYVPSFYKKVTVTVRQEDRFVYVGSFVKAPGSYPYRPGLTLLKAISVAGGFSEFGDKAKVTVTRYSDGRVETVDCIKAQKDPRLDIPLYPNDRVDVPRRYFN